MASAHTYTALGIDALTLGAYSYSIKFKKGSLHGNADALSRLLLPDHPQSVPVAPEVIASLEHLSIVPLSAAKLRTLTSHSTIRLWLRLDILSVLVGHFHYRVNQLNKAILEQEI